MSLDIKQAVHPELEWKQIVAKALGDLSERVGAMDSRTVRIESSLSAFAGLQGQLSALHQQFGEVVEKLHQFELALVALEILKRDHAKTEHAWQRDAEKIDGRLSHLEGMVQQAQGAGTTLRWVWGALAALAAALAWIVEKLVVK